MFKDEKDPRLSARRTRILKPNLDLIEPRAVLRREHEPNAVRFVAKKAASAGDVEKNAILPLGAQIDLHPLVAGEQTNERLRAVCGEVIDDEDPTCLRITGDRPFDMSREVIFVARRSEGWRENLPSRDNEVCDEAERAVPPILELPSLIEAWFRGLCRCRTFQCLDARLFVAGYDVNSCRFEFLCLMIHVADCRNLLSRASRDRRSPG